MNLREKNRVTKTKNEWDQSAEAYSIFASRSNLYQDSVVKMVQLAELEPGMTVVDLACGTGLVTQSILSQPVGKDLKIIAIDFSSQMLALARKQIASLNVAFYCKKAEDMSKVIGGKVDRIFCNAAFWQLDHRQVLPQMRESLGPSGRCLVSLPSRFSFSDSINGLYEDNKVIWMLKEECAIRGYRPKASGGQMRHLESAMQETYKLPQLFDPYFKVNRIETVTVHVTAKDYIDFLRVPIMAGSVPRLRDISDKERQEILDVVQNQLEWVEVSVPPVTWRICILEAGD